MPRTKADIDGQTLLLASVVNSHFSLSDPDIFGMKWDCNAKIDQKAMLRVPLGMQD
jgi:hypothetical protein